MAIPEVGINRTYADSGRRVIEIEANALTALAKSLDDSFASAVGLVLACKGRVIVSGMGKSGHVARKIAATLASTGTPAHFVHPAEASHGDLGMITGQDVVLLLSNSGETPELADLVVYCKRFGISLIGVAGRPESSLMEQSDVGLLLPTAPEACPMGLAPTTSTTMLLAVGDALAVTVMQLREFSSQDFRGFHPGGRLGARLLTVGALMHVGDEVPLTSPETPMSAALLTMSGRGFGAVGVLDSSGDLVGVITDGDLRRNMDGLLERAAGEVMTPNPRTVSSEMLASEALGQMNALKITTLFAHNPETPSRPAGILHVHDCLRAGVD